MNTYQDGGCPWTLRELGRLLFSLIPSKTEQELYGIVTPEEESTDPGESEDPGEITDPENNPVGGE